MRGYHILQAGPVQPLAKAGKASELTRVSQLTVNIPAVCTSQKVLVPVGYQRKWMWHLFLSGVSIHSCRSRSLSCESTACRGSWPLLSTAQEQQSRSGCALGCRGCIPAWRHSTPRSMAPTHTTARSILSAETVHGRMASCRKAGRAT